MIRNREFSDTKQRKEREIERKKKRGKIRFMISQSRTSYVALATALVISQFGIIFSQTIVECAFSLIVSTHKRDVSVCMCVRGVTCCECFTFIPQQMRRSARASCREASP